MLYVILSYYGVFNTIICIIIFIKSSFIIIITISYVLFIHCRDFWPEHQYIYRKIKYNFTFFKSLAKNMVKSKNIILMI